MATDRPAGNATGAGWADSIRMSRRTLLNFIPRRLADGQRAVEAEAAADTDKEAPPAAVGSSELKAHSRQDLDSFFARLERGAAGGERPARADSRKDHRGPE